MSLIRWQPLNEMMEINNLLNNSFRRAGTPRRTGPQLALDIYETEHELVLTASLPGARKEDLSVEFEDRLLTVRGTVAEPTLPEGATRLMQERTFGEVSRTLRIPHELSVEESKASFIDGVLEVRLPKAPEARKKSITIE